jgi:hypothetical protein
MLGVFRYLIKASIFLLPDNSVQITGSHPQLNGKSTICVCVGGSINIIYLSSTGTSRSVAVIGERVIHVKVFT